MEIEMISKDKQYRTRDGREVRIYATDGHPSEPVHGAFQDYSCAWNSSMWNHDGTSVYGKGDADLIEVKPRHKRTVWVTVWSNGYTETSSKPEWRNGPLGCGQEPIACIKVDLDFEEGEGL
jgi:hypothetical protein